MIRGDRGSGIDMLQSSDPRMKTLQENSIISFNAAFKVSLESLFWSNKSPVAEMSKSSLKRSVSPFQYGRFFFFFFSFLLFFFFQFIIGVNFNRYTLWTSLLFFFFSLSRCYCSFRLLHAIVIDETHKSFNKLWWKLILNNRLNFKGKNLYP